MTMDMRPLGFPCHWLAVFSLAALMSCASDASNTRTGAAFRFVVWGDTKAGTATLASLSRQVGPLSPDFTLYLGDAEAAGFTQAGTNAFIAALNDYSGGTSVRTFLIRGNHDASNTAGWQGYYNFSGVASTVGATGFSALFSNLTYSFDFGNSHFAGIDVAGDVSLITPEQTAWLDSDLSAAESRGLTHAFIFFHGPIYCVESVHCPDYPARTGSYAPPALIDVLSRHSIVSAALHGHEHVLAYVHVDDTRLPALAHPFEQIVAGTAGAENHNCDEPARTDWCSAANGFATFDVSGSSFTVNFYQEGSSTAIKTLTFNK